MTKPTFSPLQDLFEGFRPLFLTLVLLGLPCVRATPVSDGDRGACTRIIVGGPADAVAREQREDRGGVSAEVELRVLSKRTGRWLPGAERIFKLIEVPGDRVGSLLTPDEISTLPVDLRGTLDADDPAATFFNALSPRVRHALIQHHLRSRRATYAANRTIPGLRLRRYVGLRWSEPTVFLGRNYSAGRSHRVDLSALGLAPHVDMGNAESERTAEVLEFHFRADQLWPSELAREVWTLLAGLGISKRTAHVHVVEPVARDRFQPEVELFGFINGVRYLNLAAELISILFKHYHIHAPRPEAWGALWGHQLLTMVSDLERYARSADLPGPDDYKMNFVGIHFPNKYDGRNNFGLQFRAVDQRVGTEMTTLMDDGRAFLRRSTWAKPNETSWLAARQGSDPLAFVVASLWHREGKARPDSESAPPAIRARLMADEGLRDLIEETGTELFEAQMLTYDWAADPLYFEDVEAGARVRWCQQRAFDAFAEARVYRLHFVRDFVICAGLYERVRTRLAAEVYPTVHPGADAFP